MSISTSHSSGIYSVIKKALEGRIGPMNFILVLGFLSSLVLLYISLHVHFFSLSKDIGKSRKRLEVLRDERACLVDTLNSLTSPDRIIPIARKLGMRPGSPEEVRRLALYEDRRLPKGETVEWVQAATAPAKGDMPGINPEGR
jgi:hypothetical protein